MRPIAFLLAIPLLTPTLTEARPPKPAPRVFVNLFGPGQCPDGSRERARIQEKGDALHLVRRDCKKIKPEKLKLAVPRGRNGLESDYLVHGGRLFQEAMQVRDKAILLCRTEGTGGQSVTAVVRTNASAAQAEGTFLLGVTETRSEDSQWTMVAAKFEDSAYSGRGDIVKEDFVRLRPDPERATAELDYSFETGAGKVGERPRWQAELKGLSCYQP